jgi:hypothetical protein
MLHCLTIQQKSVSAFRLRSHLLSGNKALGQIARRSFVSTE